MGARFEALCMGVPMEVSYLGCIFFRFLAAGFEQCVQVAIALPKLVFVDAPYLNRGVRLQTPILSLRNST